MCLIYLYPCSYIGGCFRPGLSLQPPADAGSPLADFSTLKMEAIRSSETSVNARSTQHHIPEDDILQNFLLFTVFTPALRPTQYIVQWAPGALPQWSGTRSWPTHLQLVLTLTCGTLHHSSIALPFIIIKNLPHKNVAFLFIFSLLAYVFNRQDYIALNGRMIRK
jgi:hypothetical protein